MAAGGIEVDVAGNIVVHDQRKVGAGLLYLCLGTGFHVGINRESHFVSFVDGRGLDFLLSESIALLESGYLAGLDRAEQLSDSGVPVGEGLQRRVDAVIEIHLRRIACVGLHRVAAGHWYARCSSNRGFPSHTTTSALR